MWFRGAKFSSDQLSSSEREPVTEAVIGSWTRGLTEVFHEGVVFLSPWQILDWLGSSSIKIHSTFLSKSFHPHPTTISIMSSPKWVFPVALLAAIRTICSVKLLACSICFPIPWTLQLDSLSNQTSPVCCSTQSQKSWLSFPPIQVVPWYSWAGDPWPGPAAPHYHGIVCGGISVNFTALAAGKQISDGSSLLLLLSQSQTFIFNLRFGALAVRLEVIITINNRRYASSNFIFKVLYLGKPVFFIVTWRALSEGK